MTNIDQFESVFKAADKPSFSHEHISIRSVLVVTDLDAEACEDFATDVRSFLKGLSGLEGEVIWSVIGRNDYSNVRRMLQIIEERKPQLICTYRNLHIPATQYPYSLGVYVDVLTQAISIPVLLLPHPTIGAPSKEFATGTNTVMAITDHLAGAHHLVSAAVTFTQPDGKLLLTHVENEQAFKRYIETIGKIPEIDTDQARKLLLEQLLKEPSDYIQSCREVLRSEGLPIDVQEIVTIGHLLADYKRLVTEHRVDLLVMNTKDEDQLAMHGLAYPLSVELRETPLLLL